MSSLSFSQQSFKLLYLSELLFVLVDIIELSDRFSELARIHHRPKPQRGQGLEHRQLRGAQIDHHAGLAVSAERRLEQVGELRVAERHVLGLGVDGGEHVGETAEGLVDVFGFGEGFPLGPAPIHTLAPS